MKIGVSLFAWTAAFGPQHLDLLPRIKEMGLDVVEIPMFNPKDLPVAEIRSACERNGLRCTVCAILPQDINPISQNAAVRSKSIQHLAQCIETSAALGANLLGGPLYAPIGYLPEHRPQKEEWGWAVEAFQAVSQQLDSYEMTLSIEPVNRSETFFLRTANEAKSLCEAIGHPRVGVTIDTFHANIEEKNIVQALQLLGPRLKHIHASENDRGLLGKGHVDFPAIVSALKKSDYNGCFMIEGFGYDPKEKRSPGYLWADIDVSPEALALKGMQYLHSLIENTEGV